MGGVFSGQPRDVTFSPDDIILTAKVEDRWMSAKALKEDVDDSGNLIESDSSMRMKYEIQLEKDYDRRLKMVEARNEKLFSEAAAEYVRTVERLEHKYMRSTPGGCCTAPEQRVIDCYRNSGSEVLRCSQLVSEYAQCVNNFRVAMAKNQLVSST